MAHTWYDEILEVERLSTIQYRKITVENNNNSNNNSVFPFKDPFLEFIKWETAIILMYNCDCILIGKNNEQVFVLGTQRGICCFTN